MMTLKVRSLDINGNASTYLVSGDRIAYTENVAHVKSKEGEPDNIPDEDGLCLGSRHKKNPDNKDYNFFGVRITNGEGAIIQDLTIYPFSCCYIMEEGKTVDYFVSDFIGY